MVTRKRFLGGAAAIAGAPMVLGACSSVTGEEAYELAVRNTWRHTDGAVGPAGDASALQRELVRYATLAPSSHNTQCWRFQLQERAISILPDMARRCPAVDPDDHHLFVSLGCAAENLVQAALANGLAGNVQVEPSTGTVEITLEPTQPTSSALFQAIPARQCTRGEYDGQPLSVDELKLLERAGTGEGVRVLLLTDKTAMEQTLDYVVQGNTAQMNDRAFVDELKAWIRFSRDDAVRAGDGLFSGSSGNPALPHWLGSRLFDLVFTPKSENDKYAKHLRSSAGVAVFVSAADDKRHWVEAGRCYERFALQAAALGVRNAMLNQPVEVPTLRPQFSSALGLTSGRPDLVVRFGRGPKLPPSMRRPVQAVLA